MIPTALIDQDVYKWLEEDNPYWDVSSGYLQNDQTIRTAIIKTKQEGILAGVNVVKRIFEISGCTTTIKYQDGYKLSEGDIILKIKGQSKNILQAERVALNILSHMSGIATLTKRMVNKLRNLGLGTIVAATRKTLPGLRKYQKYAVTQGEGDTHRMSLSSMVLIKENHILTYGSIEEAVKSVKQEVSFSQKIEIEVTNHQQAIEAAKLDVDIIMLDNFSPKQIETTLPKVRDINSNILIEASGNINENTIIQYGKTGVDIVSMGKLTHSVNALDYTLLFSDN